MEHLNPIRNVIIENAEPIKVEIPAGAAIPVEVENNVGVLVQEPIQVADVLNEVDVNIVNIEPIDVNVSGQLVNSNVINEPSVLVTNPVESILVEDETGFIEFMKNEIEGKSPYQLYCRRNNTSNLLSTILPDGENQEIMLVQDLNGVPCSISCDNPLDVGTWIEIKYYPNATATDFVSDILVTNGQIAVPLSQNFYRMYSMQVMVNSPSQYDSQLFLFDSSIPNPGGVPAFYFDFMLTSYESNGGFRQTGIYYSPPGKQTFVNSYHISSDQNTANDVFELVLRTSINGSIIKFGRSLYIPQGVYQIEKPQIIIQPGSTIELLSRRVSGNGTNNITFIGEFVRVDV